MQEPRTLYDLSPMEYAFVERLACTGSIRRRLLDIGLIPQTRVTCVGSSPCGDPKAYLIRGAVIAIRREDAQNIWIQYKEDNYGDCENHCHCRQSQCREEHTFQQPDRA